MDYAVWEFIANIVLFLPVGVLWVLWVQQSTARSLSWWWAAPIGLTLSAIIEATQALVLPDRFADVRDLIANTLGSAIGAALTAWLIASLHARAQRSVRASRAS